MRVLIKASAMALMASVALPSSSSHDGARVGSGASSPATSQARSEAKLFPTPDLQFPGAAADQGKTPFETTRSDDPRPGQAARVAALTQAADRAPQPPASAGLQVERGDKLRLGFFETIELGGESQTGRGRTETQGALRTFYQRMDLSGEYGVEANGALSLPLLGEFRAAGRDLDDIRGELATSFKTLTGRTARVDARILDRSPVYVVGPVKSPGAVRYASGMFVLQALALAGGLDRGASNPSAMVEGAREVERLRLARLQIDRLMARRARLEAQRGETFGLIASDSPLRATLISDDGAASPPMHPRSSPRSAEPFSASESAILRAEAAKRRDHEKELEARVGAARNEVEAIKSKLDQFDIQKTMRTERLETMQRLRDRGVDTNDHVLTLRTELADIEARRQDCRVTLVQAEARLAQAASDSNRVSLDYTTDLFKEIAAVDKDIAEAREAAGSAEAIAAILYGSASPGAQPHYEIVRETAVGAVDVQASETSRLMPGDVLKVR